MCIRDRCTTDKCLSVKPQYCGKDCDVYCTDYDPGRDSLKNRFTMIVFMTVEMLASCGWEVNRTLGGSVKHFSRVNSKLYTENKMEALPVYTVIYRKHRA